MLSLIFNFKLAAFEGEGPLIVVLGGRTVRCVKSKAILDPFPSMAKVTAITRHRPAQILTQSKNSDEAMFHTHNAG